MPNISQRNGPNQDIFSNCQIINCRIVLIRIFQNSTTGNNRPWTISALRNISGKRSWRTTKHLILTSISRCWFRLHCDRDRVSTRRANAIGNGPCKLVFTCWKSGNLGTRAVCIGNISRTGNQSPDPGSSQWIVANQVRLVVANDFINPAFASVGGSFRLINMVSELAGQIPLEIVQMNSFFPKDRLETEELPRERIRDNCWTWINCPGSGAGRWCVSCQDGNVRTNGLIGSGIGRNRQHPDNSQGICFNRTALVRNKNRINKAVGAFG